MKDYSKNDNFLVGRLWLFLAITSLALSGLFAIFVFSLRTPIIQDILPLSGDIFRIALIIHVDFSVFLWLCSNIIILISLGKSHSKSNFSNKVIEYLIFILAIISMILMIISGLKKESIALMNNYIPIISDSHNLFLKGIFLFFVATMMRIILFYKSRKYGLADFLYPKTIDFLVHLLLLSFIVAVILVGLTYFLIDKTLIVSNSYIFYEILFWGGGHILQYSYSILISIFWLIMFCVIVGKDLIISNRIRFIVNLLIGVFLVVALGGYLFFDIESDDYTRFFTLHMAFGNAIVPVIIFTVIMANLLKKEQGFSFRMIDNDEKKLLFFCAISSQILFFAGCFISLFINETNTVIPAHYHGCIVGVTIASMGFVYYILLKLGYNLSYSNITKSQPIIYLIGQLIHITGLALSGGHGALRKTPEKMESLTGQILMGMMGMGALISIIAGALFVVIVIRAILSRDKTIIIN